MNKADAMKIMNKINANALYGSLYKHKVDFKMAFVRNIHENATLGGTLFLELLDQYLPTVGPANRAALASKLVENFNIALNAPNTVGEVPADIGEGNVFVESIKVHNGFPILGSDIRFNNVRADFHTGIANYGYYRIRPSFSLGKTTTAENIVNFVVTRQ